MAKKRDIEGNRLHHFELSDKNRAVRWVLIILLLVVAAVALTVGLLSVLQTPAGWRRIEASSAEFNSSDEFFLYYELGAGEQSASTELKALEHFYAEISEKAYALFYNESTEGGLHQINANPNESVEIDSILYQAFLRMQESGSRALYLAPVYATYDQVFYSVDTIVAEDCDPTGNPELRDYVLKLAGYANDPQAVQLELQADNRVCLKVGREYQTFVEENEIADLLSFGWLRNAFVVDYLAQQLAERGFTNGYITSVDGFTRNLDLRDQAYSLNLFEKGSSVAVMEYRGGLSCAFLRSYPMYQEDKVRYYTFSDGRTVTALIDPNDGQSKAATDQLVSYSTDLGCAELALSLLPLYVTDSFSEEGINALTDRNIYSIWFVGNELRHNQQELNLTAIESGYTQKFAG